MPDQDMGQPSFSFDVGPKEFQQVMLEGRLPVRQSERHPLSHVRSLPVFSRPIAILPFSFSLQMGRELSVFQSRNDACTPDLPERNVKRSISPDL